MVGRNLEHSDVRQHIILLARHQAFLLVQDGAHILVRAQQALHQEIGLAAVHQLDSLGTGLVVVSFLNQFELVGVDTFLGADLLNSLDVAHEGGVDDTLVDSQADGSDGVRIIGVSNGQTFLSLGFHQVKQFF